MTSIRDGIICKLSDFDSYSVVSTPIPKYLLLLGLINLGWRIYSTHDIPQEFKFWKAEIEPMREELLDLLESDKPTLLQRKSIGDRIMMKIVGFVDTFINGVIGS